MDDRGGAGQDEELIAFCRREHGRVVGLLSLYCGDAALAEELAQDALARVCRDWRKVRRMDHPEAWTSRVAVNLANSYFRRRAAERRARDRLAARPPEEAAAPDPAVVLSVRQAVASLPPRQRTALLLHYFCDLPFAQVADLMGAPEPTVKSLARRGIARLRSSESLATREEAPNAI
ncbi:MAG TPA: sigma-70 family RNA polymerase sigma factor [Actinomycetota bacterium]|nr:sigma-70 family RNA polymerase sigma factor [Actinomycetota bacterium]